VCIHGHFYQPPRENPWLEAIELQDSAYPYHDWNERILAECYAPNAASRMLDGENRIVRIVNNYSRISFDFGPTLLSWMEEKAPDAYQSIVEADRESREKFSGHGSAMAQAYNHMILPLANRRDKYTQVVWGIRDFEHRFGRRPEGMWLPETAVDLETLEILAELGIRFTILSPYQARRVRPAGTRSWRDAGGGRVDPSTAYRVRLRRRRSIDVFFYDGPISRAVAFEGLLNKGEDLAGRLAGAFSDQRAWPQLSHIATDGETYGHHHKHGEMALTYALYHMESNGLAQPTNYGEFLEKYPAAHDALIFENSSWSCMHGVERWRSNCGCNSGGHPDWNQEWRAPLRNALDWLRDTLAPLYEARAGELLKDPWAARNDYIDVILDRSPDHVGRFLAKHAARELTGEEQIAALKLLEAQRHAMLMYTSCGWFFDEISGIETMQVIQYAGRAIQLAGELFPGEIESGFLERLALAKSNLPEYRDGREIYHRFVEPAKLDLARVAAHYAVNSLFSPYSQRARIYCYTAGREDQQNFETGKVRLAVGRAAITSELTRESATLTYAVLHLGDHNFNGGVREYRDEETYRALIDELKPAFSRADFPQVIRIIDRHFGSATYSLNSLFRDEQRMVAGQILSSALEDAQTAFSQIYQHNAPLLRFLTNLGAPLPKLLRTAAEVAVNEELRREFSGAELDLPHIRGHLEEARASNLPLDATTLEYTLRRWLEEKASRLLEAPSDLALLQQLDAAAALARSLPFEVHLWVVENGCYRLLQQFFPQQAAKADAGDAAAREWMSHFLSLCENLRVRAGEKTMDRAT
jgi:alpha-amylase/alpha-mannosidase (GH57 family)